MIAKMQLNTARRISDIVRLKVSDFVYPNGKLREHLTNNGVQKPRRRPA